MRNVIFIMFYDTNNVVSFGELNIIDGVTMVNTAIGLLSADDLGNNLETVKQHCKNLTYTTGEYSLKINDKKKK